MKTNISQFKIRLVSRWSLVLLLLIWVGAGFARAGLSSGEINVSGSDHALQTTFDTQSGKTVPDYPDSDAETSGTRTPAWLQIILTVGIALLIYYVILAIVKSREKSREEVIHVKTRESDTGYTMERPGSQVSVPGRQPVEYRVPSQKPSESARKPRTAKRDSSWPFIIAIIVLVNIIRQCVQNFD